MKDNKLNIRIPKENREIHSEQTEEKNWRTKMKIRDGSVRFTQQNNKITI